MGGQEKKTKTKTKNLWYVPYPACLDLQIFRSFEMIQPTPPENVSMKLMTNITTKTTVGDSNHRKVVV